MEFGGGTGQEQRELTFIAHRGWAEGFIFWGTGESRPFSLAGIGGGSDSSQLQGVEIYHKDSNGIKYVKCSVLSIYLGAGGYSCHHSISGMGWAG